MITKDDKAEIAKLLERTERVGDCMEWQGAIRKDGYGWLPRLGINCTYPTRYAHRMMLSLVVGRVLVGREECALHTCDNRRCIRPDNLFLGTYQDNALDRERKGRGFDMRGENHPLYGKKHSLESKKRMSKAAKAREGIRGRDSMGRYV